MTPPLPTDIAGVLSALDVIIERSIAADDPKGYFAYVYRRTTADIQKAIEGKRFADNERMEAFDVAFANRYLEAEAAFTIGTPCPKVWETAFRASEGSYTVLQHIAAGMNAHINLDLGVAAGQFMRGKELEDLADDFRLVNDILASLTDELQSRTARVNPLLRFLDRFSKRRDEALLDFGMRAAREQAWVVAQKVWAAPIEEESEIINRVDQNTTAVGDRLLHPQSRLVRWLLRLTAWLEPSRVGEGIRMIMR